VPWLRQSARQPEISLLRCSPQVIEAYADPLLGMIYALQGQIEDLQCLEIQAKVLVRDAPSAVTGLETEEIAGEILPPKPLVELAENILSSEERPLERARSAYRWILEHIAWGWVEGDLARALREGVANTQTMADLFVRLCHQM